MLLDIYSVLNCELLANVPCNSFAKTLMTACYEDKIIVVNDKTIVNYNNIISLIEFKYGKTVMCLSFPVMYNKDKDRYVIDLDNVVIADIKYDIAVKIANHDYVCKANNMTVDTNWRCSVVNTTLASKVVREI